MMMASGAHWFLFETVLIEGDNLTPDNLEDFARPIAGCTSETDATTTVCCAGSSPDLMIGRFNLKMCPPNRRTVRQE